MTTCSRLVNTKKHNIVKTTAEDFTAGIKRVTRITEIPEYYRNTGIPVKNIGIPLKDTY